MDAFLYRVSDGQLWSPLAAVHDSRDAHHNEPRPGPGADAHAGAAADHDTHSDSQSVPPPASPLLQ